MFVDCLHKIVSFKVHLRNFEHFIYLLFYISYKIGKLILDSVNYIAPVMYSI